MRVRILAKSRLSPEYWPWRCVGVEQRTWIEGCCDSVLRGERGDGMNDRLGGAVRHLMQGAVVEKLSSVANGLILLRALPVADYGLLVLVYSVYSLVDFVVGLALGELIVSRCSEARAERGGPAASARLFQSYILL